MQLDEAYTYNEYASKPVLDGLSWYTLPNNHLLNTLLIHVATVVLGNEPWVVRLGALAAGLGLIPAIYALTRRLCGPPEGLLAAALVAASEPLIDYSTNARGYTLVALVTVLAGGDGRADPRGRPGREGMGLVLVHDPAGPGVLCDPDHALSLRGDRALAGARCGRGWGDGVRVGSGSIAWCSPGSPRRS